MRYTDTFATLRAIITAELAAVDHALDADYAPTVLRVAAPRDAALKLALLDAVEQWLRDCDRLDKLARDVELGNETRCRCADERRGLRRAAMSTLRLIAEAHGLKMEDTNND